MEDLEKQIKLALESRKICEKIIVMIGEQDKMLMEKAKVYCEFFLDYKLDGIDTKKLKERCKKYLKDLSDFRHNKYIYKEKD